MTEYIRDEQFKIHLGAIQTNKQKKARWYGPEHLAAALHAIDWRDAAILCHHTQFDALILREQFGIVPAYYYCTLSMARPLFGNSIRNDLDSVSKHCGGSGKMEDVLGEFKGIRDLSRALERRVGKYACVDTQEMWRIFRYMIEYYSDEELDLIHHTIRAYADPILQVDTVRAKKEHSNEKRQRTKLLNKVGATIKELRSRDTFANLLRDAGVEPPKKISPANGLPTYAFAKADLDFQELEMHPDARVRDLYAARIVAASSINSTRAIRLISHATPALPMYLKYGGAHTLRWSGGDKNNPQNYPRDGRLRACIRAPEGYTLVIIDSAQIEARVNAWLAGEIKLLEQFKRFDAGDQGSDPYRLFAAEHIYQITPDKVSKSQRFIGKVCILGLGYQMWVERFIYTLAAGIMGPKVNIEYHQAYDCVTGYRSTFPCIKTQWWTMHDQMLPVLWKGGDPVEYGPLTFEKNRVWLPNGLSLLYNRCRRVLVEDEHGDMKEQWVYNQDSKIYGGLLTENLVQCLARIIVGQQLLPLAEEYRLVNIVHDEGVFCVKKRQAKTLLHKAEAAFATPPHWCLDLPVAGEGVISDKYIKP